MSNKTSNTPKTDDGKETIATPPVLVERPEPKESNRILSAKETEKLAGDLEPGEKGWLPLDEDGNPTGPAVREMPEGPAAPVQVPSARPDPNLMTEAGAPITEQMQPHPATNKPE